MRKSDGGEGRRGLVIWDIDGTLFKTELVSVAAAQGTFAAYGLPVPPAEKILSFFGRPIGEWHAWLQAQCPPELAGRFVAEVDRRELDLVGEAGELYPGVRAALEALRGLAAEMAICSNGTPEYVERVLASQGIASYFDRVRYRRDDGKDKPRMVAELLEQSAARPAVVIGDRWDDVLAAHHNGLPAIGAAYGYGAPGELAEAEALAQVPADLPGLVRVLWGRIDHRR